MNDSSKGKKNRIKVGDTFVEGESIEVRNGKVYVDGVEVNGKTGKGPIVVKVLGNLKSLRVDTGNVYINGDIQESVDISSGNLDCRDIGGNVKTGAGNVSCRDVSGSVKTGVGNIEGFREKKKEKTGRSSFLGSDFLDGFAVGTLMDDLFDGIGDLLDG